MGEGPGSKGHPSGWGCWDRSPWGDGVRGGGGSRAGALRGEGRRPDPAVKLVSPPTPTLWKREHSVARVQAAAPGHSGPTHRVPCQAPGQGENAFPQPTKGLKLSSVQELNAAAVGYEVALFQREVSIFFRNHTRSSSRCW